ERPVRRRAVCQAQARPEIVAVRVHRAATHKLIAGLGELSIGEVILHSFVEIALARTSVDGKLGVGQYSVRAYARVEKLDVHDAPVLVMPGLRVLVTQA